MSEDQLSFRKRVVQFHVDSADRNLKLTKAKGRKTIYRIIRRFEGTGEVSRKSGSGRPLKIMTPKNLERLKNMLVLSFKVICQFPTLLYHCLDLAVFIFWSCNFGSALNS